MLGPVEIVTLEVLSETEVRVELSNGKSFVLPVEEIRQAQRAERTRLAALRNFEPEIWLKRGQQAIRRCRPAKGVVLAILSGVLTLCDLPVGDIGW